MKEVTRGQLITWLVVAAQALKDIRAEQPGSPSAKIAGKALCVVPDTKFLASITDDESC